MRLAPILTKAEYENLRSYMLDLVVRQALPPLHGGRPNWKEIGSTCLLTGEGLKAARREGRHAFEAIMRWVNAATKAKEAPAPAPAPVVAKSIIRPVGMRTISANSNRRAPETPASRLQKPMMASVKPAQTLVQKKAASR
ncbi:MAG TPA: hypothetical protein DDW73_09555 [Rhizobium sp.]|nr:hypothetical protein [Rhizobium sp.]